MGRGALYSPALPDVSQREISAAAAIGVTDRSGISEEAPRDQGGERGGVAPMRLLLWWGIVARR